MPAEISAAAQQRQAVEPRPAPTRRECLGDTGATGGRDQLDRMPCGLARRWNQTAATAWLREAATKNADGQRAFGIPRTHALRVTGSHNSIFHGMIAFAEERR
jgi:hypothetical protein